MIKDILNENVKKLTDQDYLLEYLNNVIDIFSKGNVYYCKERNSIEGKISDNNEYNYLQIIFGESNLLLMYTLNGGSVQYKLRFNKFDNKYNVIYEANSSHIEPSIMGISNDKIYKEYNYSYDNKFISYISYVDNESYLISGTNKKIIEGNDKLNFNEINSITRVGNRLFSHSIKNYRCLYKDEEIYGKSNILNDDELNVNNFEELVCKINFDLIDKEEYEKELNIKGDLNDNKQKRLFRKDKSNN